MDGGVPRLGEGDPRVAIAQPGTLGRADAVLGHGAPGRRVGGVLYPLVGGVQPRLGRVGLLGRGDRHCALLQLLQGIEELRFPALLLVGHHGGARRAAPIVMGSRLSAQFSAEAGSVVARSAATTVSESAFTTTFPRVPTGMVYRRVPETLKDGEALRPASAQGFEQGMVASARPRTRGFGGATGALLLLSSLALEALSAGPDALDRSDGSQLTKERDPQPAVARQLSSDEVDQRSQTRGSLAGRRIGER